MPTVSMVCKCCTTRHDVSMVTAKRKMVFTCFSANPGRNFSKSNKVGRHFCPDFQGFCSDFRQIKTFGGALAPPAPPPPAPLLELLRARATTACAPAYSTTLQYCYTLQQKLKTNKAQRAACGFEPLDSGWRHRHHDVDSSTNQVVNATLLSQKELTGYIFFWDAFRFASQAKARSSDVNNKFYFVMMLVKIGKTTQSIANFTSSSVIGVSSIWLVSVWVDTVIKHWKR